MNVAYLRVSTDKQNIDNQKHEIVKYAIAQNIHVDKWYNECVSGTKSKEERSLGKVIHNLKKGDILIISEISRISRKMFEIYSIFHFCIQKGVELHSIKENYKISNDIQSQFIGIAFGISAEIERNLISLRTKEALAMRKAEGMVLGRPKGYSKQQQILLKNKKEILKRMEDGETIASISRHFSMARGTIYAFLRNAQPVPLSQSRSTPQSTI